MREFVLYKDEKFFIQTSGRYFHSGRKGKGRERLLHRRVWADNFGPIPEGLDVHHRDEDWRNSDPRNLALIPADEHKRLHMLARMADPVLRAAAIQALRDNSHKAAEWHASPAGRDWHSLNSLQAWEKREMKSAKCTVCAKAYGTYFESRSRFCSNKCEQKEARERHKTATGDCLQCGEPFTFLKFRKTPQECCSRGCGIRRRLGHPPTRLW